MRQIHKRLLSSWRYSNVKTHYSMHAVLLPFLKCIIICVCAVKSEGGKSLAVWISPTNCSCYPRAGGETSICQSRHSRKCSQSLCDDSTSLSLQHHISINHVKGGKERFSGLFSLRLFELVREAIVLYY